MFGVHLCSFTQMVMRVGQMTMRDVGMVSGLLVIAGLMVLCSFFVMVCSVLVMRRGMGMMLMRLVCGHCVPSSCHRTN